VARYEVVIDAIVSRVIMGEIEARWILAVSRCIDVDRVMSLECPFCGAKFKRRGLLSRHVAYMHPDSYVSVVECAIAVLKSWRIIRGGRSG